MSIDSAVASNWVLEKFSATADGFNLLGTTRGYASFSRAFQDGTTVFYAASDDDGNREAGWGVYRGNRIVERTPTATLTGTVYNDNNPSPLPFSKGGQIGGTFNALAFNTLWNRKGAGMVISATEPTDVETGMQWLDSTTAKVWIWDEDKWLEFPVTGSGGVGSTVQIEEWPPTAHKIGDTWVDYGTTGELYVWDGRFWVSMTGDGGPKVIIGGGDGSLPPEVELPENITFDQVESADDFDQALARFIDPSNKGKWGRIKTSDILTNPDVTFRDAKGRFKSTKAYEGLTDQLKVNRFLAEEIESLSAEIDGIEFPETDLSDYAETEYVDAAVEAEKLERSLADIALRDSLQAEIDAIEIPEVDLDGYATEEWVTEQLQGPTQEEKVAAIEAQIQFRGLMEVDSDGKPVWPDEQTQDRPGWWAYPTEKFSRTWGFDKLEWIFPLDGKIGDVSVRAAPLYQVGDIIQLQIGDNEVGAGDDWRYGYKTPIYLEYKVEEVYYPDTQSGDANKYDPAYRVSMSGPAHRYTGGLPNVVEGPQGDPDDAWIQWYPTVFSYGAVIPDIPEVDLDGYATEEQLKEVEDASILRDEALDQKIDEGSEQNTTAHLVLADSIKDNADNIAGLEARIEELESHHVDLYEGSLTWVDYTFTSDTIDALVNQIRVHPDRTKMSMNHDTLNDGRKQWQDLIEDTVGFEFNGQMFWAKVEFTGEAGQSGRGKCFKILEHNIPPEGEISGPVGIYPNFQPSEIPEVDLSDYVKKSESWEMSLQTTLGVNRLKPIDAGSSFVSYEPRSNSSHPNSLINRSAMMTYVDDAISGIPETDLSDYVSKTEGDQTMTGPLTISGLGTWEGSKIIVERIQTDSDSRILNIGTPSKKDVIRVYNDKVKVSSVPFVCKTIHEYASGYGTKYEGAFTDPDHIATKKDLEAIGLPNTDLSDVVSKTGGDSMEGPLVMQAQGSGDSRATNKIQTLGVFSNSDGSALRLGTTRDRVYIGHNDTSFNGPIKVDEIQEKNAGNGILLANTMTAPRVDVKKLDGEAVLLVEGNLANNNSAARITLSNKTNANAYGSLSFQGQGASGWFKFNKDLDMDSKGIHSVTRIRLSGEKAIQDGQANRILLDGKVTLPKVGDSNVAGFTIKGKTDDGNNGDLLSVYHNANGYDAINYRGKQESASNIATVGYVDSAVSTSKSRITTQVRTTFSHQVIEGKASFIDGNGNRQYRPDDAMGIEYTISRSDGYVGGRDWWRDDYEPLDSGYISVVDPFTGAVKWAAGIGSMTRTGDTIRWMVSGSIYTNYPNWNANLDYFLNLNGCLREK